MNASGSARSHPLPPNATDARHELQALLDEAAWPGDSEAVCLAVHEAIMNSERHAGGATEAVARTEGTTVVVEIRDRGPGFDIDRHAQEAPDPLAERGRGLWLITQLADGWRVDSQRGDTRLCLRFDP